MLAKIWEGGKYKPRGAIRPRGTQNRVQTELRRYADTETATSLTTQDMQALGVETGIFSRLSEVAQNEQCLIFIRATNSGVIAGFAEARNVTGKTLVTKGKSSEYLPVKANLAFLATLAKSNVKKLKETRFDPEKNDQDLGANQKAWQAVIGEQDSLIGVLIDQPRREKFVIANTPHPTFLYIPKLLSLEALRRRFPFLENKPAPAKFTMRIGEDYRINVNVNDAPTWGSFESGQRLKPATPDLPNFKEFIWLKMGGFEKVEEEFRRQMSGAWKSIVGAVPGHELQFAGHLVRDSTEESNIYYQLFTLKSVFNLPKRTGKPEPYWEENTPIPLQNEALRPLALSPKQAFQIFAPNPVDGPENLFAMSVMAQAKLDSTQNRINYYEIMADYDVFLHLSGVGPA